MLNHTTLGIFVPKASIPAIQHSQIMDILQLDPAIVVDMDTTKISNTIVESSFMAEFPCTIGDKSYSIIVIGDLSSIDDSSI